MKRVLLLHELCCDLFNSSINPFNIVISVLLNLKTFNFKQQSHYMFFMIALDQYMVLKRCSKHILKTLELKLNIKLVHLFIQTN